MDASKSSKKPEFLSGWNGDEANPKAYVSAEYLFWIHTTMGIPPEIVRDVVKEHGLDYVELDLPGYQRLMQEHSEKSKGHLPT